MNDTFIPGTRPEAPAMPPSAGEGARWEALAEDPREWTTAGEGKTCRWRGSGDVKACGADAALSHVRGILRRVPWNYCAPHGYAKYGRWVEIGDDGSPRVMRWELRPGPEPR